MYHHTLPNPFLEVLEVGVLDFMMIQVKVSFICFDDT
jgi:hypothetical protein